MSCEDIPSLLDLQNTKKHVDDFGRLMGTGESDSTNEVTGQIRPTYNKVMKSVGFKPGSGDFTTGFTVMPGERDIAWYDPVSQNWYSYLGVIPFPSGHPVAPGTNPIGDVNWSPRTDQLLRDELASSSGATLVGYGLSNIAAELNALAQRTNKQRINVSAFGNTGTITVGSNEAWEAATAFARNIAPSYTNNIGQSWPDLSGFEFVADTPIYISSPLKWRHVFGATVLCNFIAADNWGPTRNSYMLDTTAAVSGNNSLNRLPLFTRWFGSFNCRYKANGIYLNNFLGFTFGGKMINYWQWGIQTGTSGNEVIILPDAVISQWTYTAGNEEDLPADITAGTGIYVNCGDCVILGVVAYYKTRGIRVNGRSCFIGAGAHIYGDRKQALLQEAGGGNLLLDGAWFDASRVELHSEAQVRNCRFFLSSGDSLIGINIPGSGDKISIKGCVFLGISSGTTAVYRSQAALANRTCVVSDNEYWDGIANSDIFNISPGVKGTATAGTTTITGASGKYTRDSKYIHFDMDVNWSAATGTGSLVITGLPFINNTGKPIPVTVTVSTSSLTSVTSAYIPNGTSDVLLKAGSSVVGIVANGSVSLSGSMRLI